MTKKNDYLPRRFIEEPLPDGPSKGQRISEKELADMLANYYELRGWDKETGNPSREKLKQLGLDFAIT
jgi:aldehyde:ferredoxin oxidoreductase